MSGYEFYIVIMMLSSLIFAIKNGIIGILEPRVRNILKKAIVTGATGFLGHALLKELTINDIFVYALCRKDSKRLSRLNNIKNIEIIKTELSEHPAAVNLAAVDINDADVFYHLAWEGQRNNFDKQLKNVGMTLNCIKMAAQSGCKRFICTGSQAEYGNTDEPITEETRTNPTTAYGACKIATYYLAADYSKRLNIELTWARVFSTYGPNDNPNTLISLLLKGLSVNQTFTLQTNGRHIWNFLHEKDAARALRLLGWSKQSNTIYNVAGRDSRPLCEFIEELKMKINPNAKIDYGNELCPVNMRVSTEKLLCEIGEFENIIFGEHLFKAQMEENHI